MDTTKTLSGNQIILGLISPMVVGIVIAFALWNAQKNNQIVRPIPTAPDAPVIPDLPDLIARLRTAKTLCEARGRYAIVFSRQHRRAKARLSDGQRLYDEASAEFNGCIDYLRSGLTRRFVDADSAKILRRLSDAERKVNRFVEWANSLESVKVEVKPVTFQTVSKILDQLLNRIDEQNEQAIVQLRDDLNSCRMREWLELGK
jgi:hypothetical protein